MKNKLPKQGDTVKFMIRNPNWSIPMEARGVVGATDKKFGGVVYINAGSVIKDEMIIRVDSLIK